MDYSCYTVLTSEAGKNHFSFCYNCIVLLQELQNEVQSDSIDNNDNITSGSTSDSTDSKVLYNDNQKTNHCEDNQLLSNKQLSTKPLFDFPDEFSAFGQYITAELRKINDPYTLAVVKHKINEIIFQASISCVPNVGFSCLGINSTSCNFSMSLEKYHLRNKNYKPDRSD